MTDALARITDYNSLVLALRARKEFLGLSDAELDHRAGLCAGHAGKLLGPSRERGIGASTLETLMCALGVSFIMIEDAEKLSRGGAIEKRDAVHVRSGHRIGKSQIAKVRPIVLQEAARRAANARWADSTPETRADFVARLNKARAAKRHARMRKAA
jgi:hypothetical protein